MIPAFHVIADGPGWIAINKPAGVNFHSEDDGPGLMVQLEQQLQTSLWPVHRLDKVTSGIILFATSADAAAMLSEEFAARRVRKYYLAISAQKPAKKQGWIKGDMTKSRNGSWKLLRTTENPAITRFVSHYDDSAAQRIFLLSPKTGRTHQLRVAMKSLGAPILGDQRYGGQDADRTYLHAWRLSFSTPEGAVSLCCPPESGIWPALPEHWNTPDTLLS